MVTTKSGKSTNLPLPKPAIPAPQEPNASASNRAQRKVLVKEDIHHALEEL